MFTTRNWFHSWRRDLGLFFSQLRRSVPGEVPGWGSKKLNTLDTAKLKPRDLRINQSRLGPSFLVKGEISGNEDLLIDGSIEGVVHLNEGKLIIGPTANVKANIFAREVVIRGKVNGNVCARYRIEIEDDGSLTGDLTTAQVLIEDGAWFKGSIEIEKSTEMEPNEKAISEIESAPAKVRAAAAGLKSI
jgi:cytoskeletal protein CcmA (bactofilin family)